MVLLSIEVEAEDEVPPDFMILDLDYFFYILQIGKLRQGRTGSGRKSPPGTKQSLDTSCVPGLQTRSTQ